MTSPDLGAEDRSTSELPCFARFEWGVHILEVSTHAQMLKMSTQIKSFMLLLRDLHGCEGISPWTAVDLDIETEFAKIRRATALLDCLYLSP